MRMDRNVTRYFGKNIEKQGIKVKLYIIFIKFTAIFYIE